jgi:chromosome segregation ATPase
MGTVEERLASLEVRMDRMDDLHTAVAGLRDDVNRQFAEMRADMNGRLTELRTDMNRRFEQVDRRFEQVDRRFEQVDRRWEQTDGRFLALESKIDRHFTWIVGIQMALMLAIIGAMFGAYYR